MERVQAVVWVDHSEARVIALGNGRVESKLIQSTLHPDHKDSKTASFRSGHALESGPYFSAIVGALQFAKEILIVGPGGARKTLAHFIHDQVPSLAPRILGVEPFEQPSEDEIVDFARKYFQRNDTTTPAL